MIIAVFCYFDGVVALCACFIVWLIGLLIVALYFLFVDCIGMLCLLLCFV